MKSMKKIIYLLGIVFLMQSCAKQFETAMKSADKDVILKTADEMYANKKWKQALSLYERASKLVAGTDDVANVVFKTAYAEYYDKNYKLAGHHFKKFSGVFPKDERREEAMYMAALCYYKGSMDYNLDQSTSDDAITELQTFLDTYPDSERAKNIRELIDELSYKLEYKAYENARQYFKMGEYKSANIAFENVLSDYPATKLRSQIYDHLLKTRYELAVNSVYDLKEERIESAIAFTRFIEKELPNTAQAKKALDYRPRLETEKENFAKLKVQVEEQKKVFEVKQKEELEKQKAEDEKRRLRKEAKNAKKAATE